VIADVELVNYLKQYAKTNKVYLADVVDELLKDWKKRHGKV
jgi:hypothetical protein